MKDGKSYLFLLFKITYFSFKDQSVEDITKKIREYLVM